MKKVVLSAAILMVTVVALSSCKKLIDKIFSGVDVKVPEVQITVPIVPVVPPTEYTLGTYTAKFDLDSSIKANTGGTFGIGVVSSVKVKDITIGITNADNVNNLSNFEYAKVSIASNTNSQALSLATLNFPDVISSSTTATPTDSPELLPYLKGSELTYTVTGKSRRITIKPLNMVATVTVRVK